MMQLESLHIHWMHKYYIKRLKEGSISISAFLPFSVLTPCAHTSQNL